MGTYRVEITFEIDDATLDDLTVKVAGSHPKLPPGFPELPPLTDDQVMDSTTSALSLGGAWKVFNLASRRAQEARLRMTGIAVHDLEHPAQSALPPDPGPGAAPLPTSKE